MRPSGQIDGPVLDVNREESCQMLVFEGYDHLVVRVSDDRHESVVVARFQGLFQLFAVPVCTGFQSERFYEQVPDFEKERQPAGHRRPECGHELFRPDRFRAGEGCPETVAVIDVRVLRDGRAGGKGRFVDFHILRIAASPAGKSPISIKIDKIAENPSFNLL